jgi:hypothetical protein
MKTSNFTSVRSLLSCIARQPHVRSFYGHHVGTVESRETECERISGSECKASILCIVFLIYWAGVEPSPLLLRPFVELLYQLWMMDGDDFWAVNGMNE